MARRTISLPQATIDRIEGRRRDGESFSAAVGRLAESGIDAGGAGRAPGYVGAADAPPLRRGVEEVLAEIFDEANPHD